MEKASHLYGEFGAGRPETRSPDSWFRVPSFHQSAGKAKAGVMGKEERGSLVAVGVLRRSHYNFSKMASATGWTERTEAYGEICRPTSEFLKQPSDELLRALVL